MRLCCLSVVLLLLASGAAFAQTSRSLSIAPAPVPASPQPPPPPPRTPRGEPIVSPHWIHAPDADDIALYYPERARRLELSGEVLLQCAVGPQGRLNDCDVAEEKPYGEDFGQAALRMARLFQMADTRPDGQPTEGGWVVVPVIFTPSTE